MKKIIITIFTIFLVIIIVLVVEHIFHKQTPKSALKIAFNMNFRNFDYTVETFEEQWCPNGDGRTFVICKFNKLSRQNIDYLKGFGLKQLPISEEERRLMDFNRVPKEYFNVSTGYYIYKPTNASNEPLNSWDYKVFVVDTVKNIAVLYYQYM